MLNLVGQGVWGIRMFQAAFPPGNVLILKKKFRTGILHVSSFCPLPWEKK